MNSELNFMSTHLRNLQLILCVFVCDTWDNLLSSEAAIPTDPYFQRWWRPLSFFHYQGEREFQNFSMKGIFLNRYDSQTSNIWRWFLGLMKR